MTVVTNLLLQSVPTQLLQPSDGMAVTADVWRVAHEYHMKHLQAHSLMCHGGGIVGGLKVRANETGNAIYVTPGLAIDGRGRIMVLHSQEQIELEDMHGPVRIVLEYKERGPLPYDRNASEAIHFDNDVLFMHTNVHPQAKVEIGDETWVELARIDRGGDSNPVHDAVSQDWPVRDEIDCRFRRYVGGLPPPVLRIGLLVMGGNAKPAMEGLACLARTVNHHGQIQVIVHTDVSLVQNGLQPCDMLYLYIQQGGQLPQSESDTLKEFAKEHVVFIECANETTAQPILRALGTQVSAVTNTHRLMNSPHLFTTLPMAQESIKVGSAGGVVLSTADCSTAWRGGDSTRPISREIIRASHEWGENLLMFALSILN